ncbi:hypothetical protein MNBD_GAMMA22-2672 [hydrothermal vent metagenome]|uniref:Outer membrane lipoprotein BamD-like domain-containing protein n=1 Tax=hydrothermal vent metagenome TaxID=652676 RepID=A0A3B0ZUZ4_9ZZZZ
MNLNKLKTIFLFLLPIFILSCTTTPEDRNLNNKISNEAYQDSLNNYNELKFLFENKKYDEAYSLLNDMKENLPYSRHTKFGKILEIHSYYEQNKFDLTIQNATTFINSHPLHTRIDYVMYLRAISSFELNKSLYQHLSQIPKIITVNRSKVRRTFSYFSVLAQKYPKSTYFKNTVSKLKLLRQVLSDYELNDAYLLFDNAKYNDVVARVDYLIKSYPRSTNISKALKLQAKAYRSLGLVDTAKSIESNVRRNNQ